MRRGGSVSILLAICAVWRRLWATSTGDVTITWAAPPAHAYNVYRGSSASTLTLLKAGARSPYVDSGLAAGEYYYTITAVDSAGREGSVSALIRVVVGS